MFKKKITIIFCLLLILQILFSVVFASEQLSIEKEDGPIVTTEIINEQDNETEMINSDVYMLENNIELTQDVSGNVYMIAEDTITISSKTIYGNLMVIAENVCIEAETIITGSVYVVAKNFNFNGITSDLYAAVSENFKFDENAIIYRDLKVLSKNAVLNGNILKNADIYVSEEISSGKEFSVDGILKYSSKTELDSLNELSIGEIRYIQKEDVEIQVNENKKSELIKRLVTIINDVIIAILVAGLISLFRRDYFETEEKDFTVIEQLVKICIGIFGVITIPVFIIMIFTTIIGWPVALVILALYILMISVAIPVAATKIASIIRMKVFKEEKIIPLLLLTALVSAVISLLGLIPGVGIILIVITFIFGFGTMILRLFRKRQ